MSDAIDIDPARCRCFFWARITPSEAELRGHHPKCEMFAGHQPPVSDASDEEGCGHWILDTIGKQGVVMIDLQQQLAAAQERITALEADASQTQEAKMAFARNGVLLEQRIKELEAERDTLRQALKTRGCYPDADADLYNAMGRILRNEPGGWERLMTYRHMCEFVAQSIRYVQPDIAVTPEQLWHWEDGQGNKLVVIYLYPMCRLDWGMRAYDLMAAAVRTE